MMAELSLVCGARWLEPCAVRCGNSLSMQRRCCRHQTTSDITAAMAENHHRRTASAVRSLCVSSRIAMPFLCCAHFVLYTLALIEHGSTLRQFLPRHGEPEKETSSKDEQAQAPKALEIEPAQEANLAEIIGSLPGF